MIRQLRHRHGKRIGSCVIGIVVVLTARQAFAATPQQVEKAITNAQKYLLAHRGKAIPGTWELAAEPKLEPAAADRIVSLTSTQWGGLTAIATYALLASGEDPRSDELKPAVDFLLRANIESTYGMGLSSQIVQFKISEKDAVPLVKRNVQMFLAGMYAPPKAMLNSPLHWPTDSGFYSYWTGNANGVTGAVFDPNVRIVGNPQFGPQPKGHFDRSNSQYAVLGMWALADAGGEIPEAYWFVVDQAWKRAQHENGSWTYVGKEEEKASMTAAGIATLFITQDFLLNENWALCRGGVKNPFIERGLSWMDKHVNEALGGDLYTMYGIERIGTASGRKYFEDKDWYQIGADYLVKHQTPDGAWLGGFGPIPSTSFGLLFLSRGRAPVLMNKLQYTDPPKLPNGIAEVWNERPRDVANLARWVGKEEETYFNWQSVNLKVSPDELHDAPILYISGSQPLAFNQEEMDKLRMFVEQGGIILGNADCGQAAFSKSFQDLGRKLFPKYRFEPLASSDPIYREQFKDWRNRPRVLSLNNRVRHLMLLVPELDAARAWQTRADRTREAAFGLGTNIYLYSVESNRKNMLTKGDTWIVKPDPKVQTTRKIKVARLEIGENSDPEPGGWPRLAAIMHNNLKIDLEYELVKPDALAGYSIAHLTGAGKLTLSSTQRNALKQFVSSGGTLIIDAAGGDNEFAGSVEVELGNLFGGKLETLPDDSPIYNQPAVRVDPVGWRQFALNRVVDRKHPHLRGIRVGERFAVLFSREDLTVGLVGQPVDGIYGYDPATAVKLMEAMILSAAGSASQPVPAAAQTPVQTPK